MCVEAIASYIKAEDPSYYSEVRPFVDISRLFGMFYCVYLTVRYAVFFVLMQNLFNDNREDSNTSGNFICELLCLSRDRFARAILYILKIFFRVRALKTPSQLKLYNHN